MSPKKYFHIDNQCDIIYHHLITQPIAQIYYSIRKNKCKSDVDTKKQNCYRNRA